jgi:hypothetical protein
VDWAVSTNIDCVRSVLVFGFADVSIVRFALRTGNVALFASPECERRNLGDRSGLVRPPLFGESLSPPVLDREVIPGTWSAI